MLMINFFSFIAKLAFVFGYCNLGLSDVNNFDLTIVGISVLLRLLKQTAFKTAGCFYIIFVITLNNSQRACQAE
jgi:hypothetical protein